MCGILKFTLSGTLVLTKFPSFDRSGPLVSVLALFNIFAMDAKYSLSFVAIVLESETLSLSNVSSSGKVLFVEAEEALTVLKCFHIVLVSFKFSTELVKCDRFAFLISLLVLLRSCLYSCQSFKCLHLSRALGASPISSVYHSGRRLDLTLLC